MAENIYGKNFARVTAECLNERHTKGIDAPKVYRKLCRMKNTELLTKTSSNNLTSEKISLLLLQKMFLASWMKLKGLLIKLFRNNIKNNQKESNKCLLLTDCLFLDIWDIEQCSVLLSRKVYTVLFS